MEVSRRGFVAGSAAALLAAHSDAWADALADDSLVSAFAKDRQSLKATRITAAGVETFTITAETLGKSPILQFLNRKATDVAIYSAPAKLSIPRRTISAEAPELLFVIDGATTLVTDHGSANCILGSLTIMESGAVSEQPGLKGYTAIRVRLAAS